MYEDAAKQLVYGIFFDVKRYDLGKVGRRFLNQKLGIDLPLFVVIILSVITGVLAGGVVTWVRQGHWRRAARRHEADAAAARAELATSRPSGPLTRPNALSRPPA